MGGEEAASFKPIRFPLGADVGSTQGRTLLKADHLHSSGSSFPAIRLFFSRKKVPSASLKPWNPGLGWRCPGRGPVIENPDKKKERIARRKARAAQARNERQNLRRVCRLFREAALKMEIDLSPDLKVLSWRGRSDPDACAAAKSALVQTVEMLKSGWTGSGSKPWSTVDRKHLSKFRKTVKSARKPDAGLEKIEARATMPVSNSTHEVATSLPTAVGNEKLLETESVSQCDNGEVGRNAGENESSAKERASCPEYGNVDRRAEEISSEELWAEIEVLEAEIGWWKAACETSQKELHEAAAGRRRAEEALAASRVAATHEFGPAKLVASLLLHPRRAVSVSEALTLVSALFPARVVVLPSALESASKLDGISKRGNRLLNLLLRLATDYYEVIAEKGDSVARKVFTPDEYSAHEAQTTRDGPLGKVRDFAYHGTPLKMEQHLKIGIAADTSRTLRCYFAWLADERKLVIGHCGEHLPVSSHK